MDQPAIPAAVKAEDGQDRRSERVGLVYALLAVLFFSTSPVLIRWADPLSPYEKTVGRLLVATAALVLLLRLRGERLQLRQADLPRFAGFGLILALHFVFYIGSLGLTTIAHSLAILYTAPIFVTLGSALLLKEPLAGRQWVGVVAAVAGVAILAGFEPRWNRQMALGDLLALGGAITYALYSLAGRWQRARYPLLTYAAAMYAVAALWALPAAILSFTPQGYRPGPLLAVVALGLLPLGVGHTLYNAALRRTHATVVNLIATQELTGGILLGLLLLGEAPRLNEIAGAAVTLLGIALVMF